MRNLKLIRFDSKNDYTRGVLKVDKKAVCFTLEDEYRGLKIRGETRIPSGTYDISFRKVLSPMTKKYRKLYPWFEWHLEIEDVPEFKYVYIHVGNTDDDTDACVLVGDSLSFSRDNFIKDSLKAYKSLYIDLKKSLDRGEKVQIRILAV